MIALKEINLEDNVDWDELIKRSNTASFFQTKEWLMLWVKHFGGNPYIVGVFDGVHCIGIAPFEKSNNFIEFLGTRKVLGGEFVSDYGDIIAIEGKEHEVWKSLLSFLPGKNGNTFQLQFIRQDSPSVSILEEEDFHKTRTDIAAQIVLPSSWDDYLISLDRHERHELRRKLKKNGFSLDNLIISDCTNEDAEAFFRLMESSSEEKVRFLTEEMRAFFKDIISLYNPKKNLQLVFLRFEDKYIAGALLFFFRNDVLLYNSGFDTLYYHMAPGYILSALLIQRAIEAKKMKFDFLRGDERYKFDLGAKGEDLYTCTNQGQTEIESGLQAFKA